MRTPLLALPFALLLATPAWADGYRGRHGGRGDGHRGYDDAPAFRDTRFDLAFAVVHNPNAEAVDVLLDGERVAVVAPGETRRVGPFAPGVHDYVARFADRLDGLRLPLDRQRLVLDGRHPTRIGVPFAAEAIVAFDNRWIEPMDLRVDGRVVAQAMPGATRRVLAPAGAVVEITGPHGELAMQVRVRSGGLASERFCLVAPPVARLSVHNPLSAPLELFDADGRQVGYLPAGRSDVVVVAAGTHRLEARFRGRVIDVAQQVISPFRANTWGIQPPPTAFLEIRNDQPFGLTVVVQGRIVGQVGPRSVRVFDGLPVGAGQVEVIADDGLRGQATAWLQLDPLLGATWAPAVRVHDGRGGRIASGEPTRRWGDDTVVWRRSGR